MTPFIPPFSIKGEASKPISATTVTLESINASNVVLTYRSFAADTLTWFQQTPAGTSYPVPASRQKISLYDGAGRRIFAGTAKVRKEFKNGIAGVTVTCANGYDFLKNTSIRTTISGEVSPEITFPKQPVGTSISSILSLAVSAGWDAQVGTVPAGFEVSKMPFKNDTYDKALVTAVSWLTDVSTYMDYETNGPSDGKPIFNLVRRGDAREVVLDLDAGVHEAIDIDLQPNGVNPPTQVRVRSIQRKPTGEPYFDTSSYGPGGGDPSDIQDVLVSAGDNLDSGSEEPPPSESFFLQTISGLDSRATTLTHVLANDSTLAGIASGYGATWYRPGALEMATGSISWGLGSSTSSGTGSQSTLTFEARTTPTGARAVGWYAKISSDPLPSWIGEVGISQMAGYLSCDIVFSLSWATGATRPSIPGESSFAAAQSFSTGDVYSTAHSRRQAYRVYRYTQSVTLVNANYSGGATIYRPTTGGDPVIENPPSDLAQNLYLTQQWYPQNGSASLGFKVVDIPRPGDVVSVTNAPHAPEWVTVKAPVSGCEITLDTMMTKLTFDLPSRLDVVNLLRRFPGY